MILLSPFFTLLPICKNFAGAGANLQLAPLSCRSAIRFKQSFNLRLVATGF